MPSVGGFGSTSFDKSSIDINSSGQLEIKGKEAGVLELDYTNAKITLVKDYTATGTINLLDSGNSGNHTSSSYTEYLSVTPVKPFEELQIGGLFSCFNSLNGSGSGNVRFLLNGVVQNTQSHSSTSATLKSYTFTNVTESDILTIEIRNTHSGGRVTLNDMGVYGGYEIKSIDPATYNFYNVN
jgi:hypothetical protein